MYGVNSNLYCYSILVLVYSYSVLELSMSVRERENAVDASAEPSTQQVEGYSTRVRGPF